MSGPLGKLLSLIAGAILLAVGLIFSAVILVVVAVAGLAVWGYFRWKTRKLRKGMQGRPPDGAVFEGEAVVVEDVEPPGGHPSDRIARF